MKQTCSVLALTMMMVGGFLAGCESSSEKKIENAADNVIEAQKDLDAAEKAYAEEWEKFRLETEQRIASNENEILTYREREKTDKEFSKKYRETIDRLEAKNEEMKEKMRNARENTKDNWEEFKREFNHDMDELGTALKDLTRDNKN